jgi:hypothetical protein
VSFHPSRTRRSGKSWPPDVNVIGSTRTPAGGTCRGWTRGGLSRSGLLQRLSTEFTRTLSSAAKRPPPWYVVPPFGHKAIAVKYGGLLTAVHVDEYERSSVRGPCLATK